MSSPNGHEFAFSAADSPHVGHGQPTLTIRNLSKSFGRNPVLQSFNLSINGGTILVLVGQNGSGKSTLIKILSGYHTPDPAGEVSVAGQPLQFGSADAAYRLGCRFVHQDLGLVSSGSVLDNLSFSVGYPTRLGTIQRKAAVQAAAEALDNVGLAVDPRKPVSELTAAQRTGVALARALRHDGAHPPRLLVLDEPTATFAADEVGKLIEMLRTAAARQVAVLFVTHRLDEVFQVADAITILRDGLQVGTFARAAIDRPRLVELLTGGTVEDVRREHSLTAAAGPEGSNGSAAAPPPLAVRELCAAPALDVSFLVAAGEVVGIAGLTGSGRETLLAAIFGAIPRTGQVEVAGTAIDPGRPEVSIAAGAGFVPADRMLSAAMMTLSAAQNFSITSLRPYWRRWRLDRKQEMAQCQRWFDQLQVRPENAADSPLSTFSGGNQQKIVLARWLHLRPKVLLLDEPTQGVDIGAKADIHRFVLAAAERGTAVLVSSTDTEELVTLCDRVLVMRNGRVGEELSGPAVTLTAINRAVVAERCDEDAA